MLVELFIFFEIVAIGLFITSFFTKQEILWALTLIVVGFLMASSYDVEVNVYSFNANVSAYVATTIHNSYPYLMGINMAFFVLALILGLHDIFEKYGFRFWKKGEE